MSQPAIRTRRWSRIEYERLIEAGVFHEDEPIELLDGVLVVREPQGTPHATAIRLTEDPLRAAFGHGWDVRGQLPVALDDASEPKPDVAVVPGGPRDYRDAHPSRPALIVEIAETSLDLDRIVKGRLYARAGVADYWIVNLIDRVLEVSRDPGPVASDPSQREYRRQTILEATASVSPLAAPSARIRVADLLP